MTQISPMAALDVFLEITLNNLRRGIPVFGVSTLIGQCLERVEPGRRMRLDSLVLFWLSLQPGFSDAPADYQADEPLHVLVAQQQAFDRWSQHLGGLTGNPSGASLLREDLCPGADCWIRFTARTGIYAAAVQGRHGWHEATGRDEASAMLGATIAAYEAAQALGGPIVEEAPFYAAAAE